MSHRSNAWVQVLSLHFCFIKNSMNNVFQFWLLKIDNWQYPTTVQTYTIMGPKVNWKWCTDFTFQLHFETMILQLQWLAWCDLDHLHTFIHSIAPHISDFTLTFISFKKKHFSQFMMSLFKNLKLKVGL